MTISQIPIAHIVCHDRNGVIGSAYSNDMLWKCKQDMSYFRENTLHKICIMGYNTYKSILQNPADINTTKTLLKNRICIVIADPNRMTYPKDNAVDCGYLIDHCSTHSTLIDEEHDTYEIEGFTAFAPNLSSAISLAKIFSEVLCEYVVPGKWYKTLHSGWAIGDNQPKAFIIGGGRLYRETFQHANVTHVYQTILPISCKVQPEWAVKYPESIIMAKDYSIAVANEVLMDISYGATVSWRQQVNVRVWTMPKSNGTHT